MATRRRQVHYAFNGTPNKKARGDEKLVLRTLTRGFASLEEIAMDRKYLGAERLAFHADGAVRLYQSVGFLPPDAADKWRSIVTFER